MLNLMGLKFVMSLFWWCVKGRLETSIPPACLSIQQQGDILLKPLSSKFSLRISMIFIILTLVTAGLSAADIIGKGYGETEEEALRNSRADCISSISVNIIYAQTFTTTEKDGAVSNEMATDNYTFASMELIGKKEKVEKVKDGYKATTTIPSSSAPAYATRVNETRRDAKALKEEAERKGDNATSDDYLALIAILKEFNAYRAAVAILNPALPEASFESVCTIAMAESLYRSTLQKESNGLEMQVKDLERRMKLGLLEEEGEQKLSEVKKLLDEARNKQKEERERQEKEYSARMTALQQQVKITVENLPTPEIKDDTSESLEGLINAIEADRSAFFSVMTTLRQKLSDIEQERKNAAREIERSYNTKPLGERTVKDGKVYYDNLPENFVLEQRNLNRQTAVDKSNKSYRISATEIYNEYFPILKELRTHAGQNMAKLNSSSFVFTTASEGVNAWISDMDYQYCSVMAKCILPVGDKMLTVDLIFPFREFIKDEFTDPEDVHILNNISNRYISYSYYSDRPEIQQKYMRAFGTWYKIVSEYPELFSVKLDVRVINDGSHKYIVYINGYTIYRNTEGLSQEIYRDNTTKTYTIYSQTYTKFDYMTGYEDSLLYKEQMLKDSEPLIPAIKADEQTETTATLKNNNTTPSTTSVVKQQETKPYKAAEKKVKKNDFVPQVYLIGSYFHLDGGKYKDRGESYFEGSAGYRPNKYFFIAGGMGFAFSDTYTNTKIDSETGKPKTSPNCGMNVSARVGLTIPGTGVFRFDGTAGVSAGFQHFYTYSNEQEARRLTHFTAVDLTYGMSLCIDMKDAGKTMGMMQLRVFGMTSYNSVLGKRTGWGLSCGLSMGG